MSVKRKVVLGAVAVHLSLAALFAPHVPLEPHLPAWLDHPIAFYGGLSGVHTHFDFFAPSVATQARVVYVVHGKDGSVWRGRLATPSAEVNNRIAIMLTHYSYPVEGQKLLHALADYMLRQHPDASSVEARIEALQIPPLAEAARGARPAWVEIGRKVARAGQAHAP